MPNGTSDALTLWGSAVWEGAPARVLSTRFISGFQTERVP